ncbi:hypothetical protein U4E84_17915, partial [Halorubrum sp. AD140]|uniref:hypothetical protein n=1 Tax=Halorubrum sp. AD140 TaxID=3050073 RepID=UPI002ACD18F3
RLGRREVRLRCCAGWDSKGRPGGRRRATQAAWRYAPRIAGGEAAGDTAGANAVSDEERSERIESSRPGLRESRWKRLSRERNNVRLTRIADLFRYGTVART